MVKPCCYSRSMMFLFAFFSSFFAFTVSGGTPRPMRGDEECKYFRLNFEEEASMSIMNIYEATLYDAVIKICNSGTLNVDLDLALSHSEGAWKKMKSRMTEEQSDGLDRFSFPIKRQMIHLENILWMDSDGEISGDTLLSHMGEGLADLGIDLAFAEVIHSILPLHRFAIVWGDGHLAFAGILLKLDKHRRFSFALNFFEIMDEEDLEKLTPDFAEWISPTLTAIRARFAARAAFQGPGLPPSWDEMELADLHRAAKMSEMELKLPSSMVLDMAMRAEAASQIAQGPSEVASPVYISPRKQRGNRDVADQGVQGGLQALEAGLGDLMTFGERTTEEETARDKACQLDMPPQKLKHVVNTLNQAGLTSSAPQLQNLNSESTTVAPTSSPSLAWRGGGAGAVILSLLALLLV